MSKGIIVKETSKLKFLGLLCILLVFLLVLFIYFLQPLPSNAAVNLVELRFDASSQVGGNMITEFVDSTGVEMYEQTGLSQDWAKTRYDNSARYVIANFAIWSNINNPDAGYSENGGVISYTGIREPGGLTTKQLLDMYVYAGVKPVVFFHGVPGILSANGYTEGEYGYNKNLPSDANMDKYRQYIRAVAQYLADNFGIDEISKWAYEFASESDWQIAGTAADRAKTIDYWLAGLEDVIGAGNVYAGTYFSKHPDSSIRDAMITHFGNETNYCTGEVGTRLSYFGTTTWIWNNNDMDLDYLKGEMDFYNKEYNQYSQLKNAEYRALEHGRGEPGIVAAWADQFGASYYAYQNDVYTQFPVRKNIINFGDWGTTSREVQTDPHLLTPAFNMYRIERDMAGQRLLPVALAGTKTNSANSVGGYASALDESTTRYNLVVYNFNADYNTNVSENVKILLDNIPGTQATVKEYIIDSNNNNWWTNWRQYRETNNYVPYVDRTGDPLFPSWSLPTEWDVFNTTDDAGYNEWKIKGPSYVPMQNLYVTNGPTTCNITDGILELNRTLSGHSVLYITIDISPTASSYGSNMDFENGNLGGWTTSGTVAVSSVEKKDGSYSVKLSGMSIAEAYAKQTVTGLTAGKRYTLSGWGKPNGTRMDYGIYMQRPGENSSRITCNGLISPLQEWNRMAVTLEADSNGTLEIGVIAPNQVNQKDVYFDSLRLQRSGIDSETSEELAHFKFDENSGTSTNDSSTHAFTGTISGATWTTGKYGSGLSFDGINSKYVEIANQYLNISSDFSIAGWIKAPQDRDKWHTILAKGSKDMGHFEVGLDMSGKLYFYAPDIGFYVSNTALDDNNWHHVAVIRKGNNLKLYTDNIERFSTTIKGVIVTEYENIRIGTLLEGTLPFNGIIDDVQIYSGALTLSQLTTVYNGNEVSNRPTPAPIPLPSSNPAPTPAPTATPAPAPTPMPDNRIGEWELNENSGSTAHDISILQHDGTVTGATWTGGMFGSALSFNGTSSNYVNISNADTNIGNNFTISVWIKAIQDRSNHQVFIAKGPKNTGHYELYIDTSGILKFYSNDIGDISSNTVVDNNNWHHVVVTYDGSNMKFYVDKVLKNSPAASGTVADETETMRLGSLVDGTLPYNGLLDEVRIFNRALTQTEIKYLYKNISNYNKQIYSEWKLNENSGNTAHDASIPHHDGTVTGASWTGGMFGSALSFNGTSGSYVNISNADVNVGNNFTMSAWIKAGQNRSNWQVFLAKGPKDSGHYELSIDPSGILRFYANDIGDFSSNTVVDDNNWHNIVVTCDGSNIKFYVDKALKNSSAVSGYIVSEAEAIRFGSLIDGTLPYNGLLDEVKIINHALTQAEIDSLYNGR